MPHGVLPLHVVSLELVLGVRASERSSLFLCDDARGVENVESDGSNEHQRRIEQVDEDFLGHEHSVLTHDVLDNSKDRSDHNESTRAVQNHKELVPWRHQLPACIRGLAVDATVEDKSDDHEKAEEKDLNHKADDNDHLSSVSG